MKRLLALLVFAVSAFAADSAAPAPKDNISKVSPAAEAEVKREVATAKKADAAALPDEVLKRRWKLVAQHHAVNSQLQASLTSEQRKLQEGITQIDNQINAIAGEMTKICEDRKMDFDAQSEDPACKPKPVKEEKK